MKSHLLCWGTTTISTSVVKLMHYSEDTPRMGRPEGALLGVAVACLPGTALNMPPRHWMRAASLKLDIKPLAHSFSFA